MFSLTRSGVVFVLAALTFGWTSKTLKDCRYQASTLHSLNVSALSVTAVIVVAGAAAVAVTALEQWGDTLRVGNSAGRDQSQTGTQEEV